MLRRFPIFGLLQQQQQQQYLSRSFYPSSASASVAFAAAATTSIFSRSVSTANNAGVATVDLSSKSEGKIVLFGGDAREMMLGGIERIAKAVSVTLGPKGRNVVIRQPNGEPKITKDGVTVARAITFSNQFEDVGARLVRQVASKTNDIAGDGTTTATVLAWSIFAEGYKAVATGANPMDLKRGIETAVEIVRASLKKQTRRVSTTAELINVATISANGERRLGEMIAHAVECVGVTGFIAVLDGRTQKTEWSRHGGWSVESGFFDSQLCTDTVMLTTKFAESVVFVTTDQLTTADDVIPAMEAALHKKQPLVVAAADVTGDAFAVLRENHLKGILQCLIVKVPTADAIEDLAACCGCIPVNRDTRSRLSSLDDALGTASGADQNMDSTVVVGTADVATRIRYLEKKLERANSELERDTLRERIAKLNKTFAVIRVGGQTSVEIMESKDRVIDALNAARAALTDGIVAGGGAALLHASKELDVLLREDEDMTQDIRTGIFIVRNAIRLPMRTIGDNAGVEGPVIVSNVLEEEDAAMGYDAQNNVYTNMFDAGIVDPTRVVECCIMDAASVAGLKITTEAIVCEDKGDIPQPKMNETVSLLSSK